MKTGAFMCFALVLGAITIPMAEGSSSGGKTRYSGAHIISLAKNVEKTLAAEGARVAIISRVGRDADVLPDGIRYTHVAFAVYSQITTTDGERIPGYAVYNLYQDRDQPAASSLVQDFPVDYFAAVHELRSGIIIPTVEMQKRLLATIFSNAYPRLHHSSYSVFSNPFDLRFQNCTEFVLNVIQAAVYDTADLRQIKLNTRKYFEPQRINIGRFKLFLAQIFKPDVKLSDHDGPIRTTTFSSIARYMQRYELATRVLTVAADT